MILTKFLRTYQRLLNCLPGHLDGWCQSSFGYWNQPQHRQVQYDHLHIVKHGLQQPVTSTTKVKMAPRVAALLIVSCVFLVLTCLTLDITCVNSHKSCSCSISIDKILFLFLWILIVTVIFLDYIQNVYIVYTLRSLVYSSMSHLVTSCTTVYSSMLHRVHIVLVFY